MFQWRTHRTPRLGRAERNTYALSPSLWPWSPRSTPRSSPRSPASPLSAPLLDTDHTPHAPPEVLEADRRPDAPPKMHAVHVERPAAPGPPDMWDRDHRAIYAHYACVGCVSGLLANSLLPYCLYVAHGEPNTCATTPAIRMLAPPDDPHIPRTGAPQ